MSSCNQQWILDMDMEERVMYLKVNITSMTDDIPSALTTIDIGTYYTTDFFLSQIHLFQCLIAISVCSIRLIAFYILSKDMSISSFITAQVGFGSKCCY